MKILLQSTMHDGSRLDTVDHADLMVLQAWLINALELLDELKDHLPHDIRDSEQIDRRIGEIRQACNSLASDDQAR